MKLHVARFYVDKLGLWVWDMGYGSFLLPVVERLKSTIKKFLKRFKLINLSIGELFAISKPFAFTLVHCMEISTRCVFFNKTLKQQSNSIHHLTSTKQHDLKK